MLISSLDLQLEYDNRGKLQTQLYHKRDDFDFTIPNFSHWSSNITYCLFIEGLFHNLFVIPVHGHIKV